MTQDFFLSCAIAFVGCFAIAALSGCSEMNTSPLTSEERAAVLGAILSRPQPQPYVAPIPQVQMSQMRMCQSTINGQIVNTTCY